MYAKMSKINMFKMDVRTFWSELLLSIYKVPITAKGIISES